MNLIHDLRIELIPLLITLLETLSVTECAKKMGVTQSAVSHSLRKLREQLDDEIVIRDGNKLVPTTKAEKIYPVLKRWLGELEFIFESTDFNPQTSKRIFYIAATDIVEQVFMPRMIKAVERKAPHVSLRVVRWNTDRVYSQLMSSEIDMAIGVRNFDYPNLMQKTLYEEVFVSAVRKKHPFLKSKRGLEEFLSYPHTMTSVGDRQKGVVDSALEKLNRSRVLTHTVANFSSTPYLVENSECILTAPRRFLEFSTQNHKIEIFEPPIDLPIFNVKLFWSKKAHQDQAHTWLRDVLYTVFKA